MSDIKIAVQNILEGESVRKVLESFSKESDPVLVDCVKSICKLSGLKTSFDQ